MFQATAKNTTIYNISFCCFRIRCEDFSTEKTVFAPSPLSSPPKTPHHLRLKKVHHLRKTRTNLYNSTVNEKRESEGSISSEQSLKEMGRERTQQLLFPKIKLQKTIVPSKYGYHPRSHSPTHKQLVQCRKKLDALIEEKLHQAAKDRDDNPALSPRTFYELYCGTTKATSAAGVGYTFDKLDCISTEKELPKRGVLLDSSLIQIKFSLPSLEDLLENSQNTLEEETNNEPKETEGGQVKHYHGSSLPQIIIPAPVPVMDETDILSDETDESVSVHDISKWEASLKEKMAKVKSTGDAMVVSNREPNQDETKIPIVSSTESIDNISKRKKIKTKKKKSRTKTNVKKEKKNMEVKENKPLKSDELIYDKSKAKAVTKVAESHGLTAEEANELYLTRDSKLVSQKYLDRLNQMAFGSDESDNEEYDSNTD